MLRNSSWWSGNAADDDGGTGDDVATSGNDDPQLEEACLFLVILAILVCCCFSTCIVRRLRRLSGLSARYLSAELTQPLLEDADHDSVFVREGGEWRCPVCLQENRQRREACDVCGLGRSVATSGRAVEAEVKALRSAGFDEETLGELKKQLASSIKDVEEGAAIVDEPNSRQRRAARRRRWVRSGGKWMLARGAHEDEVIGGVVVEMRQDSSRLELIRASEALLLAGGSLARYYSTVAIASRIDKQDEQEEQDDERAIKEDLEESSIEEEDVATDTEEGDRPPSLRSRLVLRRPSRAGQQRFGHRYHAVVQQSEERWTELRRVSKLTFGEKHLWLEKELETLRRPTSEGHARLEVRRDCLLEDSVQQLLGMDDKQLRQWMRVQFVDEPGIDVGGLEREWFGLACDALLQPAVGVFSTAPDGACRCEPSASMPAALGGHPRAEELYEFAGRLIGKAIVEHVPLKAPLAVVVYKQLLAAPLEFEDLADLDADLARNVAWLLENDGVADLDLDFAVAVPATLCAPRSVLFDSNTFQLRDEPLYAYIEDDDQTKTAAAAHGGGFVVRELCPDGRAKRVDDENKLEYVRALWRYHVVDATAPAVWNLAKGLFSVVPSDLLSVFDAHELDLLVCGSPIIDVDDWANHTEYAGEYRRRGAKHPVITWFWSCVRALDQAQKAKLLQFCTGSSRVPCHGFKALQRNDGKYQRFCIQSLPRNELRFPRAHTCFNRLDLPLYSSKDELEASLNVVLSMDCTGACFNWSVFVLSMGTPTGFTMD